MIAQLEFFEKQLAQLDVHIQKPLHAAKPMTPQK